MDGEGLSHFHVYAACFCEQGDLLSQWRGYANGGGVAIGFDTRLLQQVSKGPTGVEQVRLQKALYGRASARPHLDSLVAKLTESVAGFPGATAETRFGESVLPVLARIKHPGFAEENEWRLILASQAEQVVDFRGGSLGLVPFVKFDLPPRAIVSVRIGPSRDLELRMQAARRLKQKYNHLFAEGAEILSSGIPFRS